MNGNKVLVIGLGQIGYSNAEYMTMRGLAVDGFDISEKAIQRAIDDQVIQKKAQSFAGYDYYIICISTHRPDDMFSPYLDGLYEIAGKLSFEGKPGALIGIDSTVTRGTSELIKDMLRHRMHVVHVPHRFYVNEKHDHGVRQTRVIGGCEKCCLEKAKHFYGELLDIPLHEVESIEVAELCKIVENSYRFVEIAFAEDRGLTGQALLQWKAVYVPAAIVYTEVPENMKTFVKQQKRWKRGTLRVNFFMSGFFWRKNPIMAFLIFYMEFMHTFISPLLITKAFFYEPIFLGNFWVPLVIFSGMMLVGLAQGADYKFRDPKSRHWLFKPLENMLAAFVLSWLLFPAIWSLRRNDWGTR